jgi:DNA adenine methylase
MQDVIIRNHNAIDLVLEYRDNPNAVLYLDPPYLPSVRTAPDAYRFEMNAQDHMHLLDAIRHSKATIFLSGYPSPLYAHYLPKWYTLDRIVANSSGQNEKKQERVERLWCNKELPGWSPVQ